MNAIWKFPIDTRIMRTELPKNSMVLTAQMQNNNIVMWVICNTEEKQKEPRIFRVFDTGEPLPEHRMAFIATIQDEGTVHHIFEMV